MNRFLHNALFIASNISLVLTVAVGSFLIYYGIFLAIEAIIEKTHFSTHTWSLIGITTLLAIVIFRNPIKKILLRLANATVGKLNLMEKTMLVGSFNFTREISYNELLEKALHVVTTELKKGNALTEILENISAELSKKVEIYNDRFEAKIVKYLMADIVMIIRKQVG